MRCKRDTRSLFIHCKDKEFIRQSDRNENIDEVGFFTPLIDYGLIRLNISSNIRSMFKIYNIDPLYTLRGS